MSVKNLFLYPLTLRGKISGTFLEGQSLAQTFVGGEGISTPTSEALALQKAPSPSSNLLEDIFYFHQSFVERLKTFSKFVTVKGREKDLCIQELSSK